MAFHVAPELEAKLDERAHRTHRDKSELLEEAVKNLVACKDHGDVVANGDVQGWLEQRERS